MAGTRPQPRAERLRPAVDAFPVVRAPAHVAGSGRQGFVRHAWRISGISTASRPFNVGAPELGELVVDRPRLVDALLEHVERSPIVSVVAVAGAGKTTLAAQVAREAPMPVAWLTIEDWDRNPGRFAEDLVAAVSEVAPGAQTLLDLSASGEPPELARAVGSVLGAREALLVLDDVHLIGDSPAAAEVLGSLVQGSPTLRLLLVGRTRVAIPGVGADAVARSAEIGDDFLAADSHEAAAILEARGSVADPDEAVEASAGWVAGIVLESSRGFGNADTGLAAFLAADVRPRLSPEEDAFLVGCSVLDYVSRDRASALVGDDGPQMLATLRGAGLPGIWGQNGTLRMHPRIRELLRAELATGPAALRRRALEGAASALEAEGALEQALEVWLEADAGDDARRLLPAVIGDVVARLDIEQAHRLLDAVPYDEEPPEVMYARLCLAYLAQQAAGALPVLDALEDDDRFAQVVQRLPEVGALACLFLAAIGRVDDAFARYELLPPSRARDATRFSLSTERDDPVAPIPPFAGDMLDGVICYGLYGRGRLAELHRITSPVLAAVSGVPDLASRAGSRRGPLADCLVRLKSAVSRRDAEAAYAVLHELEGYESGSHIYNGLVEAEIAIRIERDPEHALRGIERARALPEAENVSYREAIDVWRGAALLLAGDALGARDVLSAAVDSMRRGDRLLRLPTALVYLAEAEWREGEEGAADRATTEAHAIAREHGGLSRLLLALADFPGVVSRALDLETVPDGEWHALGRALLQGGSGGHGPQAVTVHLRELGDPMVFLDGLPVRPKLRKSLELLSFLLSSPGATAARHEILTALWNGRDDDASRAYLRQAVRHLRDALPDEVVLTTEGDALSLAGAVTSEVAELDALIRAAAEADGPTRRALLLDALAVGARGTFLEGSDDVTWVDERRAAIAAKLVSARLDAAATLLDESRFLEALALADEALAENPLLERGWRLRMRALGMLGDHDGVLDAFRSCSRALELVGLVPARSTVELARTLRG